MVLLRFSSMCRHVNLFKYPVRTSYFLKYGQYNGNKFLTNCIQPSTRRVLFSTPKITCNQLYAICKTSSLNRYKHNAANPEKNTSETVEEPPEKLSLFKRYHKMLKEYWYVLIPVHMVTSAIWFGGFYYAAKSGLDIVPFLEYINIPDKLINPLRNSSLGHIAVASALYKLATPARYMVTLGGTTFAVKFLTKRGLIRPAPTKAEIKTLIKNKLKKDTISEKEK